MHNNRARRLALPIAIPITTFTFSTGSMQGKYIRLSPKPCLLPSPKSPVRRPRGDAKKCRLAKHFFLIIYLYLFLQPTEAQGFYYIICTQYSSVIGKLANKFLRFGQFVAKNCFLPFSTQNQLFFF